MVRGLRDQSEFSEDDDIVLGVLGNDSVVLEISEVVGMKVGGVVGDVRIDSLGMMAYGLNPRGPCKQVTWLAKQSEPAYMWSRGYQIAITLPCSRSKDLSHSAKCL